MQFIKVFEKKMAPNFLDLATTLENLGARWLLEKKVNFVPCRGQISEHIFAPNGDYCLYIQLCSLLVTEGF